MTRTAGARGRAFPRPAPFPASHRPEGLDHERDDPADPEDPCPDAAAQREASARLPQAPLAIRKRLLEYCAHHGTTERDATSSWPS